MDQDGRMRHCFVDRRSITYHFSGVVMGLFSYIIMQCSRCYFPNDYSQSQIYICSFIFSSFMCIAFSLWSLEIYLFWQITTRIRTEGIKVGHHQPFWRIVYNLLNWALSSRIAKECGLFHQYPCLMIPISCRTGAFCHLKQIFVQILCYLWKICASAVWYLRQFFLMLMVFALQLLYNQFHLVS